MEAQIHHSCYDSKLQDLQFHFWQSIYREFKLKSTGCGLCLNVKVQWILYYLSYNIHLSSEFFLCALDMIEINLGKMFAIM